MRNAIGALLLCLSLLPLTAQQANAPAANSLIYGTVTDSDGDLAKEINVVATPLGVALALALPHARTDRNGRYRFERLPWGRYTVCAEDPRAGYSHFSAGTGYAHPPEITISPQQPEAELNVRLPPKAGFLQIHLTNQVSLQIFTRLLFLSVLLAGCVQSANTSAAPQCAVGRAYVDPGTGRVHIVYTNSSDVEIPPEKDQVLADPPVIAADHETVAWTIQVPNCCTSYPIPIALVVFRCGKIIHRIADGMMVYKWWFVNSGREVVVSSGTVHGMQGVHLCLYNSLSGRRLKTWDGDETDTPPRWGLSVAR